MKKAEVLNFPQFEEEILKLWEKEGTFEQSVEQRKDAKRFSFYDGPPFANGLPHYGHALASAEKDAVVRYKTMRGYFVPRRAGWDTHGLPVEYEVEKQLKISSKKQILEMGIEAFNQACRDSVFKYRAEWEQFIIRFGRWIDLKNAYATLDTSYIESVWWVFSELYKKGLIYQGFKSMPYCPRCATPLSNFELNQGYQDNVEDPSVFVKFPMHGNKGEYFLAWTTTPWTLPANAALAVKAEATYVQVKMKNDGDGWSKGDLLWLAESRLEVLDLRQGEYEINAKAKGKELEGQRYKPLYEPESLTDEERSAAWKIYLDESVDLEDGTGILHVAPRYGETDLELGLKVGLPLIESVDASGQMTDLLPQVTGQFFKEADPHIVADLVVKGHIFAAEKFTHTYPFCWRCDTALMYFATPSWFVQVTKFTDKLINNNQKITWVPAHIKDGRFGNWIAEARDWGVSRSRFWGAPLPVWQCAEGHFTVIGGIDELKSQATKKVELTDLHRPYIDAIELKCSECDQPARRVEEVFDCWFESGSMPYAEDHYPFENQQEFKDKFPADFIAEGMDQTRGWFYTLHVLASALFDQPAFENVIVNGIVVAADGKKLSKRLRNYPDISEVLVKYGADSLRFFLLSSSVVAGEDVRFSLDIVGEVNRNIFMTLWNVYNFLATYAEAEQWQPGQKLEAPQSRNVLDRWILARLEETTVEMTKAADRYELHRATRPLRELVDDLSNWYLRRSRRRFSKNDDKADKVQAYATLHYVLVRLCQLLAPWSPFTSEKMYRELAQGMELPASVHLTDWPEAGKVDTEVIEQMALARSIVNEGLAQRAAAGIKVRQPLGKLAGPQELEEALRTVVKDEVNVKEYVEAGETKLDIALTKELRSEGLARDVIRLVQDQRKLAGLKPGDHIKLDLEAGDELAAALTKWKDLIQAETLAVASMIEAKPNGPLKVSGHTIAIKIERA